MKFVQFTYVDAQTGKPLSEAPATNGPSIPEGFTPTFDIQSTRTQQAPKVYGFVEDGVEIPDWVSEVDEEAFFLVFKQEIKDRVNSKRKEVDRSGIIFKGDFFPTDKDSQSKILSLVSEVNANKTIKLVDFEVFPGTWKSLSKTDISNLWKEISNRKQEGFSWAKEMHKKVDDMELNINCLENVLPVYEEINSFGLADSTPEGEELTDEE